ncbi:MAG: radical SAM protein [Desulfobulbales bacterium]
MFDATYIPDYRSLGQTSEPGSPQIIQHDSLGDLSAHNAFIMRGRDRIKFKYSEILSLFIHISVTGRCQARCQDCINTAFNAAANGRTAKDNSLFKETEPDRDARYIVNLIQGSNNEDVTICLYGGEPLLAADKMQDLMANIAGAVLPNNVRYMLYTNGELLEEASRTHPELLRSVWLYSVSIDGTRTQHERIRRGTNLKRIHAGLSALKNIRQGQVLMWSTLREDQSLLDCFNEFTFLYDRGLVDQFFWHWVESSDPFMALAQYAATYEEDLHQVMQAYVVKLKSGTLLPITHINELVLYLLAGSKRKSTACGVELDRNYDIVDGKIHSCADLPAQFSIGTIEPDGTPIIKPHDLSWLVLYKNDLGCMRCGVHNYCGGRCPVQAVTGSITRLRQYCQLMRLHVSIVSSYLDEIIGAMELHSLTPQFIYDKSAFYVQFTDGTP